MSNNWSFPFNQQPAAVSQRTSSYTLTGTYARVIVTDFELAFTVNGSTIIPQLQLDSNFLANSSIGEKFRNNTGYELALVCEGVGLSNSTQFSVYNPDSTASGGANTCVYDQQGARANYNFSSDQATPIILMPPGSFLYKDAVGSSSGTIHFMVYPSKLPPVTEFRVPLNASLNGSSYYVEEYNPIS